MFGVFLFSLLALQSDDQRIFEFGGLNASTELTSQNPEIVNCAGDDDRTFCSLARTSFAGLKINHSTVEIRERRLHTMSISGPASDYKDVLRALAIRYGQPDTSGQQWNFKDGNLRVATSDKSSVYVLLFVNKWRPTPKIDF